MEMDRTLKILIASLGVAGIAVLAIPNGDPLASSAAPAAASPATGQTTTGVQQSASGNGQEAPKYIPPASDQVKSNSDPITTQMENFGQPMVDARPMDEQKARPEGNDYNFQQPMQQPQQGMPAQTPMQSPAYTYAPPPSIGNGATYSNGVTTNDP